MKKLTKTLLLGSMLCASLSGMTGCSSGKIQIGILQPIEHDALDLARQGFEAGLAANGYKDNVSIDFQNANGVEADLNTLAKSLTGKCSLTLGIGTGASQALQAAQVNSGSTNPILFTAVTDAVDAKLVESNEHPGGYITGTSDANPVEAQIDLIKECLPNADKIGILYTQSETNSEVQANQAEAEAKKQGLEVKRSTCTDSSDLSAVAEELCKTDGLDAIYIPTDNLIAANMHTVKAKLDEYHILCVTGEESMMTQGGHVTLSISYYDLGVRTGKMAAEILSEKSKPADMAVTTMSKDECSYLKCEENITASGLTIAESVLAKCSNVAAK